MSEKRPSPLPERYDDRGPFAKGGTAAVHLAVDSVLARPVATKVNLADDPEDLERFRREAQVTARLEHPNIVPVYDLGDVWFTMKRVHGETLGALVRRMGYGPAMLAEVVDVLLRVCDALAFAHDRNVIHRDVKPENVMVGELGQVYLMDWGIAAEGSDKDAPWAGTASWMAPEQARGEACDARTDVWGVGGLLYAAICGGRPNAGNTPEERVMAAVSGRPPKDPALVAPQLMVPPELARIAMKALQPDPAKRYPDIRAFAADLREAEARGWWFQERIFEEGEELLREGDAATTAFLIVEGSVEIRQGDGPIAEVGAGEIVGETALLADSPRTATVIATSRVVARVITRESLDAELRRRSWLGALVKGLASRFAELSAEAKERRQRPVGG